MAVLRQLALVLVGVAILYGGLLAASLLVMGGAAPATIDTGGRVEDRLLFGLGPLAGGRRTVAILGASNVCDLPLEAIQSGLGGDTRVHNLCAGASNISQIDSVAQIVEDLLPAERRTRTTLVIGLWYGLFSDNQSRWHGFDNSVDQLRLRYSVLYRKQGGRVVRVLPPALFPAAGYAMLPVRSFGALRQPAWGGRGYQPRLEGAERDKSFRERLERFNTETMGARPNGAILPEQFELLVSLVERLAGEGFTIALLDLPVARWHKDNSLYFKTYQSMKMEYISSLTRRGVHYIDMQDFDDDASFADGVHLTSDAQDVLSPRLAARIKALPE